MEDRLCIPEVTTEAEAVWVVVHYLENNQLAQPERDTDLVLRALENTYRCRCAALARPARGPPSSRSCYWCRWPSQVAGSLTLPPARPHRLTARHAFNPPRRSRI